MAVFSVSGVPTLTATVAMLTYSPTCGEEGSFPLNLRQHLLFFVYLRAALTGVRRNLSIILICIFLGPKDVEHFACNYLCHLFLKRGEGNTHISVTLGYFDGQSQLSQLP